MEISVDKEQYETFNFSEIKRMADQYAVRLWSMHLPFYPFNEIDPSFLDKGKRRKTVEYFTELIHKGAAVGIDKFVIHASGEPIGPEERAERLSCSQETLAALAETASRDGALLCVEDLPRSCLGNCAAEMLELLRADDRLRACFDTNHLLQEDAASFIKALGSKIVTTHISDYDFVDEKHWLPGEGCVDWPALFNALKAVGYKGVWLYEIAFLPPHTLARSRPLTCEDFVRNAREIFTGSPLTVIPAQL